MDHRELDKRIASLRIAAERATSSPLLPKDAKVAVVQLVEAVATLADEVAFLRRDFTQLSQYRTGQATPPLVQ